MLPAFQHEVLAALHFMQLARIALRGSEPVAQPMLEPRLRRRAQGIEKSLDRQEVAHCVAFHRASRAPDMRRLAVGLRRGDRETHLAPAGGAKVDLHRQPSRHVESVGIRKMDERAAILHRHCLEHDAVIARAERSPVCIQRHLKVARGPRDHAIHELQPVGLIQRLLVLAADAHIQDASLATQGGTAVFRIDGQDQDFAPVPRAAECRGHRRERVIDERIGVARHANRGLAGLQIERFMELIAG